MEKLNVQALFSRESIHEAGAEGVASVGED